MIYVHKDGKVAEYTPSGDGYFNLAKRPDFDVWFENKLYRLGTLPNGWYESKEEAYKAAIDYHEEGGCKAYLELYPAPEKDGWNYIAQNANGKWHGYECKPDSSIYCWFTDEGEEFPMIQSPANPFWRKTLR